ncbi:DUF6101 family protein [Pseudovibrio sp. SPO723]|uniref:DUF6101 family protein n=1 Tax=Nesiotobacter zosterae TaxID=392721 RepID=UPI0029C34DDA|nr:DUF6101 family protein [Pseudovibrio sp. SPO723]MDX5592997.1 DUF6101 family protein [Pseudovibrio sp. SPO723]
MEASAPGFVSIANPGQLPISFTATVEPIESCIRVSATVGVTISREQVEITEFIGSVLVRRSYPTTAFDGVAVVLRSDEAQLAGRPRMVLELRHPRPGLRVPLFEANDLADIVAEWQLWAKALALPLLLVDEDTGLSKVANAPQSLYRRNPLPRRKTRGHTKNRPRFLVGRQPGDLTRMKHVSNFQVAPLELS